VNLVGAVPAGGYYLIQLTSDGANGVLLPPPDLTGAINMGSTAGKVALVIDQTNLNGACPLNSGRILDMVGYGATANCSEGGSPAPSPSTTTSVSRLQAGCADLDQNASDFAAGAANPRNIPSTPNICACIARNESGAGLEADYCAVQFPLTMTVQTGATTPAVFGELYETGVTEPAGSSSLVRAQLGYGPPAANPQSQAGWVWANASYNQQVGNNDEYQASFIAPAPGSYRYVYRFSLDQGVSWTYCDKAQGDFGAGSNPGLTFDLENEAVLTVTP